MKPWRLVAVARLDQRGDVEVVTEESCIAVQGTEMNGTPRTKAQLGLDQMGLFTNRRPSRHG
eukprot:7383983-Prymnesium_polylepis.1